MGYDAANYTVRREDKQSGIAGAASATMAKFLFFQKSQLKGVHALITTAGTNSLAGFDIYVGTDSVGDVVYGTNTAGVVVHNTAALNASIPANGMLELKGKASSATAVVSVNVEYEVEPDAVGS